MVFYFILFLSSILLFCTPFSVSLSGYFDTNDKKLNILLKIIFFNINIKKLKKKKKKKKNFYRIKIKIKKLDIKKPIRFGFIYRSARSNELAAFEKRITKIDPEKLSAALSKKFPSVDIALLNREDTNGIKAFFSIQVKVNLFLIFSSVLQTITIRRNKK